MMGLKERFVETVLNSSTDEDRLIAGLEWVYQRCYSWRSIIKRTALRFKPLIWTINGIYRSRVRGWIARESRAAALP